MDHICLLVHSKANTALNGHDNNVFVEALQDIIHWKVAVLLEQSAYGKPGLKNKKK